MMNPGTLASLAAIGVFCLTLGLSYPRLALILDSMGIGTALKKSPFFPSFFQRPSYLLPWGLQPYSIKS